MARTETHTAPVSEASPIPSSPLRLPVFRAVWVATTVSYLGALVQSVGASWLMTSITDSADMVALVQSAVTLPLVVLSLFTGAMADNMDRRKMMLSAQVFMLIVGITLTLCAWFHLITPWLLLFFTFLVACGGAYNAPAWQASVGDMVPRAQLPAAVALNSISYNIARSVGPAIGGVVVAAGGAAAAFALNALSYIGLIGVLARWRPATPPRILPPEPLGIAVAAGIRYVSMSPVIRAVLLRGFCFGFGASVVMALLPLVAKHLMGGGPLTFGTLLGAFGIGAITGALSIPRLRETLTTEGIVRWWSLALALATAVLAVSKYLWLTLFALWVGGASWVLVLSTLNVTVQMSAPRWVVARALSLYQMMTFGGLAISSWLWGTIAERYTLSTAILWAAVVTFASAVLGLFKPLTQLGALNLDPLHGWKEPKTVVPVEPRTGPVVVTIEYLIDEEDVLEFLAAMAERRRIRKRDGALNWLLLRDLGDARLWIERFQTPTWLEYIRHNTRMTHDDAQVPERLRALHRGAGPPVVRRMIERQTGALPTGHGTGVHDPSEE